MTDRSVRIDAHQHFWEYTPETHAWIDGSMEAIRRDFFQEDLEPELTAAGFDGCIAVQAQQDLDETRLLVSWADEYDFIRGVVGWFDLRASDVRDQIASIARGWPQLCGVRHIVQDEPDDRFMLRDDFQRGIATLAEFDLAYDILIYARQLPAAVELARAFPDQRFVLDHIGKPDIRNHEIDRWSRGIAALARNRNVWCKLSGMVTEADWKNWTPDTFTPYLDVIFDWFGPDRVMFGSDWPVCLLAGSYSDVTNIVRTYVEQRFPSHADAIFGETAAAFYHLPSPLAERGRG